MSRTARLSAVLAAAVVIGLALAFLVIEYLLAGPPTVAFAATAGQPVNLTLQADPVSSTKQHPDWVSYFVKSPGGDWVRSTLWQLPAATKVNVTIESYDTCTPLRNPIWSQITGTDGGTATIDGKATSTVDSWGACGPGHTFSIPDLGINIPLVGISPADTKICTDAPCKATDPHHTIVFSFTTPSAPGDYRWQCFIPCGLGFLDGNGGPMSTIGYMTGFIKVVA
jgi:hypothetical protein